mgnify:FL=1
MTLKKRQIKNKIPLYISKDYMYSYYTEEDEDDDEMDDYGYFCTENETTQVAWKRYDEDTHLFQKKHNDFYGTSDGDIESIYTDVTDSGDEPSKISINSIYMSILRLFYSGIYYISIFMYKVKP